MSLRTSYEAALHRREHQHAIPPMTDPLGQHWDQPSRDDINVNDQQATMTRATLDKLAEYSTSMPSGVYMGKMWKRRARHSTDCHEFLLCWYDHHEKPGMCTVMWRKIVLLDPLPKPIPRCVHGAPMDMRCPYCTEAMTPSAFPGNPRKA